MKIGLVRNVKKPMIKERRLMKNTKGVMMAAAEEASEVA